MENKNGKPNKHIKKIYNWKYHKKLTEKYDEYLNENKNKNNLRLKGNYHYKDKSLNYYLTNKNLLPIKNTNLTPVPQTKYLKDQKEKYKDEYYKYSNMQKSVIEMRRIEYKINLVKKDQVQKKLMIAKQLIESIQANKFQNNKRRKSVFFFNDKDHIMLRKEILTYIFNNNFNVDDGKIHPSEVINYLTLLVPEIIKIQRNYRKHQKYLKKIIKLQSYYKAHLYHKLFQDFYQRKSKINKFIFIIQKVLFLNLYHLKFIPKIFYAKNKCFISKKIYTYKNLNSIIYLQRKIKFFLKFLNLKKIYGKTKCVYVKPFTSKPIGKIKLLQRNVILFLERLKRRHSLQQSQIIIKKNYPKKKIILIQKFAKTIHPIKIRPKILKEPFERNNTFIKNNRIIKKKITLYPTIDYKKIGKKKPKIKVVNHVSTIIKSYKSLGKLIFLQKKIKEYFSREDYDIFDFTLHEEYVTKESFYLKKKEKLIFLQRQIKYFLYRLNVRKNNFNKVLVKPLRCTKIIRTNAEKIFTKLTKMRFTENSKLINLLAKVIFAMNKYRCRIAFQTLCQAQPKIKKTSTFKSKYFRRTINHNFNLTTNKLFKIIEEEEKKKNMIKKSVTIDEARKPTKNKLLKINLVDPFMRNPKRTQTGKGQHKLNFEFDRKMINKCFDFEEIEEVKENNESTKKITNINNTDFDNSKKEEQNLEDLLYSDESCNDEDNENNEENNKNNENGNKNNENNEITTKNPVLKSSLKSSLKSPLKSSFKRKNDSNRSTNTNKYLYYSLTNIKEVKEEDYNTTKNLIYLSTKKDKVKKCVTTNRNLPIVKKRYQDLTNKSLYYFKRHFTMQPEKNISLTADQRRMSENESIRQSSKIFAGSLSFFSDNDSSKRSYLDKSTDRIHLELDLSGESGEDNSNYIMIDSDSEEEGKLNKINSYEISIRKFNENSNNKKNTKNDVNKKRIFLDKKNKEKNDLKLSVRDNDNFKDDY